MLFHINSKFDILGKDFLDWVDKVFYHHNFETYLKTLFKNYNILKLLTKFYKEFEKLVIWNQY